MKPDFRTPNPALPPTESRVGFSRSLLFLLCALACGLVAGFVAGFVVNSEDAPTLRAAANSCVPWTQDLAQQTAQTLQIQQNTKAMDHEAEANLKLIDACTKKSGVPQKIQGQLVCLDGLLPVKELGRQVNEGGPAQGNAVLHPRFSGH